MKTSVRRYLIDVADFFGPCKRGRARLIEDNVIAGRPGVKGYRSGSAICRMKYIKIGYSEQPRIFIKM